MKSFRFLKSRARALPACALLALAYAATGCAAPAAKGPVPGALDGQLDWFPLDVKSGTDQNGRAVDVIEVRAGDVVRISTASSGPIEIAERVKSGTTFAETWSKHVPQGGFVTVRTTLLGGTLLAPKGTISRAHIGLGHDPGYEWFAHEQRVLDWADGPLPAPFPQIAPKERIDYAGIDKLDRVLADAVAKAKDPALAKESARAIRRVVGLRAVRAIRPMEGFPYFYDSDVTPDDASSRKTREMGSRKAWLVTPSDPLTVTVDGPRLLQVATHGVQHDDDEQVDVRVLEGERLRAKSGGIVPKTHDAHELGVDIPSERAEVTPLRRAVIHVPPGKHTYKIEAHGGSVFATAYLSKPVVHVGDALAGTKSEEKQLKIADRACDAGSPSLCALATALEGRDAADPKAWQDVMASLDPAARESAEAITLGGPRDPLVAIELAAARGDGKALAALGASARNVIDDGVRGAWLRGTTRGTRWVVADSKDLVEKRRWLAMIGGDSAKSGCGGITEQPWTELGKDELAVTTDTWRGAPTLELMAATSCSAGGPIGLEVDGEKLAPNPSGALVKWHVLVHGKTAHVRRTDGGDGKVWAIKPDAAACGAHWGFIGSPRVAKDSPELSWAKDANAPGVELWLREGAGNEASLEIVSKADPSKRVKLVSGSRDGFVAIDNDGKRWVRVARVGLPVWAAKDGATVIGGDGVAVRAIVRAPKTIADVAGQATDTQEGGTVAEAEPLDEAKLVALSKAILASQGTTRGDKYLERALMLARGGEARAAMEDARAAKLLGAKADAEGDDIIGFVRAQIRPKPRKALELPASVKAYGVEPDFDPVDTKSARCVPSTHGPRGQLASVVDELKTQKAAQSKVWDPNLAIRAFEAVNANAVDPRSPSVLSWALAGSRWQVPKAIDAALLKVQRPHDPSLGGGPADTMTPAENPRDGAIDPDGDLRARILTGLAFDRGSYAIVTDARPAKVALSGSNGAKARVEVACVPRSPADAMDKNTGAFAKCPVVVTVGDPAKATPMHVEIGADGKGSIELPQLPPKGAGTMTTIAMEGAPGRFIALARVVFDKEVPGTKKVDGLGYVVMPDGLQWRWLVKSGEELKTNFAGPGLFRVDARREPEEQPKVVVIVDGKEQSIPVDGNPHVVAVPKAGLVTVRSIGGAATISVAERVAKPALPDLLAVDEAEADPQSAEPASEPTAVTSPALLDAGDQWSPWRDTAAKSPRPLTPFEESVGTVTLRSLAKYGTLREGEPAVDEPDHYFEQSVGYRRRVESIDLWTGLTGMYRGREGNDSWGASAFLFKTIDPLRLRIAGWADVWNQKVGFIDGHTWRPHGYIEVSTRPASNFFLLPRVGYDGFYSNLPGKPVTLDNVDDDVYNGFRFKRPTLGYAQLLAWWVPYFNDILLARARANLDVNTGALSHVSVMPGGYFAFGKVELDLFAQATWYKAIEGIRSTSGIEYVGSGYLFVNQWYGNGSLDFQPGIGGRARTDGAWEVVALINVLASFQRGLRDFASPELNFPEQFGGNVPWRGFVPGGMR